VSLSPSPRRFLDDAIWKGRVQLFFIVVLIAIGALAAIGVLGYVLDESMDGLERDRARTRRAAETDLDRTFVPGELPPEHSGRIS
jgi:hypothetical protein